MWSDPNLSMLSTSSSIYPNHMHSVETVECLLCILVSRRYRDKHLYLALMTYPFCLKPGEMNTRSCSLKLFFIKPEVQCHRAVLLRPLHSNCWATVFPGCMTPAAQHNHHCCLPLLFAKHCPKTRGKPRLRARCSRLHGQSEWPEPRCCDLQSLLKKSWFYLVGRELQKSHSTSARGEYRRTEPRNE